MKIRTLQVFFGADGLPYKDQARTVHYPIVGNGFQGANNTTQVKFYFSFLGDSSVTWVAVSKLPNGKIGSKVLQTYNDSELGEPYALLELDSFYTQYKGDIFISLQGYQGGVQVEYDSESELYVIHGTPTIQATGSVKFTNNYATQFVGSGETDNINFQRILAALGTKLGIRAQSEHVEELPSVGQNDIFYVVNDDPNDPNLQNIYVWNENTQSYVWVGDNTLDLGNYYTKQEGQDFEQDVNNQIDAIENQVQQVASGSPKGVYSTLADLQAAYPTGTSGIFVVSATGHWYYWNGGAWTDGGTYQATSIGTESITIDELNRDLASSIRIPQEQIGDNYLQLDGRVQACELKVYLKAGVKYVFSLDDYPSNAIQFFADSNRTVWVDAFTTTKKSFEYTPGVDRDILYLANFATKTYYSIKVEEKNNILARLNQNDTDVANINENIREIKYNDGNYYFDLDGTVQACEINVNLKAGIKYKVYLADFPTNAMQFFSNSDRTAYISTLNSTTKSFEITPSNNLATFYIANFATKQHYNLYIEKVPSTSSEIADLNTKTNEIDLIKYNDGGYSFVLDGRVQSCELKVKLKAGKRYRFYLKDYPTSAMQFFSNPERTSYVETFTTTKKEFDVVLGSDLDTLYIANFATKTYYDIYIEDYANRQKMEKYHTNYRYLVPSFMGSYSNGFVLLGTNDLKKFDLILKKGCYTATKSFKEGYTNTIRDPAIIQIDDWYYITYTVIAFESGSNQIGFCRTKDFIEFEELDNIAFVHNSITFNKVWAPSWFRDDVDDKIYIVATCFDSNNANYTVLNEYDVDNHTLTYVRTFPDGLFDSHIYKENGYYYLINDTATWFKSSTLNGTFTSYTIDNFPTGYEAEFLVKKDGTGWRLYLQHVMSQVGDTAHMYYCDIDSLEPSSLPNLQQVKYTDYAYDYSHVQQGGPDAEYWHWTVFDLNQLNGNNNNWNK